MQKMVFEDVNITVYAILSEIWGLNVSYFTNLENKIVIMALKPFKWFSCQ